MRAVRPGDGCLYLGPLSSTAVARRVAEAVESAVPIRRCTGRPGRVLREGPCTPAQLGVATCPCAGTIGEDDYRRIVERVVQGLTVDHRVLLDPLAERMAALARAERFEEAADMRDRAGALAQALHRQRRLDRLRRTGRLELELPDRTPGGGNPGRRVVLAGGRLLDGPERLELALAETDDHGPIPRHLVDELACVAAWLDAEAGRVGLVGCEGELASALPPLPRFAPAGGRRPQPLP